MLIAIDAGNTRIKWALHDGQAWQKQGYVETHAPDLTQALSQALQGMPERPVDIAFRAACAACYEA